MRRPLLLVLVGYLVGAIPVPYVAGRLWGHVDLLETGTGSAGPSNLWHTAARRAVAPVGVAQIVQGALPPLLARSRGETAWVQVASGLAAIAAQDWNPALGWRGGRGMTHSIGFLLAVSPPSLGGLTACGLAGVALRQIPLGMIAGLGISPAIAARAHRPKAVIAGCGAAFLLALAKRLDANHRPLPSGAPRARTLLYRALLDRDMADRGGWLSKGTMEP